MAIKYCEFQPSEHRNKKPATLLFLDDEQDKFPMAVCAICAEKIKKLHPNAIIRERTK